MSSTWLVARRNRSSRRQVRKHHGNHTRRRLRRQGRLNSRRAQGWPREGCWSDNYLRSSARCFGSDSLRNSLVWMQPTVAQSPRRTAKNDTTTRTNSSPHINPHHDTHVFGSPPAFYLRTSSMPPRPKPKPASTGGSRQGSARSAASEAGRGGIPFGSTAAGEFIGFDIRGVGYAMRGGHVDLPAPHWREVLSPSQVVGVSLLT